MPTHGSAATAEPSTIPDSESQSTEPPAGAGLDADLVLAAPPDPAALAGWAAALGSGLRIDAVAPWADDTARHAARAAAALGLRGNPDDAVRLLQDRQRCGRVLRGDGFAIADDRPETRRTLHAIGAFVQGSAQVLRLFEAPNLPAGLPASPLCAMAGTAEAVLATLGLSEGLFRVVFQLTDSGTVRFVTAELGCPPRWTGELLIRETGLDLADLLLAAAFGRPLPVPIPVPILAGLAELPPGIW